LPLKKKAGKRGGQGYEGLRQLGAYSGLGIQLVLITLVFFYAGWRLDHYIFATYKPVFTLILSFLGGAAAFYRMYRPLFQSEGKGKKESGS
jgi:F0F1-type ATP synthase assembly protein I